VSQSVESTHNKLEGNFYVTWSYSTVASELSSFKHEKPAVSSLCTAQ